jgi:hypothetical protein
MSVSPGGTGGTGGTGAGPSALAVAPSAPGRLGEPLALDAARNYLLDLGRWRDARKRELDLLDAAALRASEPDLYTADVTLSMSLWQAVDDRYRELIKLWDDGRVDTIGRDRLSQLVWGRLASGGLGVNVVEATRLSDALAAQLRARMSFDPRAAESGARVAALRAGLERLRELVKQEPMWAAQVETLATRVNDIATRATRGADVTVELTGLETDAARAERDLVVTTARRRNLARRLEQEATQLVVDRVRAENEVRALSRREDDARALVAQVVQQVADAPRFAVPDVEALGAVPADRAGLDAFLRRLSDVARALQAVETAYGNALREREELIGLFGGYATRAARTGRTSDPEIARVGALARAALEAVPTRLADARALVSRYVDLVRTPPSAGPTTSSSTTVPPGVAS